MIDLKTAAIEFNSDYPEAAQEIKRGTPMVDIDFDISPITHRMIVVVTPGVQLEDETWAAATEPVAFGPFKPFDQRDYLKSVRWAMRRPVISRRIEPGTTYRIRSAGSTEIRETRTW